MSKKNFLNSSLSKLQSKDNLELNMTPLSQNLKNNNLKYNITKTKNRFTDYELNSMPYKNALIYDNRTYLEYYFSLLRTKHLLIFSIYPNDDYNSKDIKIILFFFSFALYFTINALFFNDATMHKIYEHGGVFNIVNQIIQILG